MSLSRQPKRKIGTEFLCKVRYRNPLPAVPFPPKLLPIPPTYADSTSAGSYSQARLQHYVRYQHSTLEEATAYALHLDADLGMPIDPCLLGAFDDTRSAPAVLAKEDEFLVSLPTPPAATPASSADPPSHTSTPRPRERAPPKHKFDHSRSGQVRAIAQSFDFFAQNPDLLTTLRHPTNQALHAVSMLPLFPDSCVWANAYTAFALDTPPDARPTSDVARDAIVFRPRRARTHLDADEQWVESFVPEDAISARNVRARLEDGATDEEFRFERAREYDMPIRPESHRQDLYMFTFADGEARYVPVKSRVMLKRRQRTRDDIDDPLRVTSLALQFRPLADDELAERSALAAKLEDRSHETADGSDHAGSDHIESP